MRGRMKKGIALILSAVISAATLATTLPQAVVSVYAAGTDKDLQLGASALAPVMTSVQETYDWDEKSRVTTAQTVYYGSSGSQKWYVIGCNGAGAVQVSNTVTLFAPDNMATGQKYKDGGTSHSYVDSDIRKVLIGDDGTGGYYNSKFTDGERGAIVARTLTQDTYRSTSDNFCDGISDAGEPSDKLWLLSTKEADRIGKSYRTANDFWWLRSPGNFDSGAATVNIAGQVGYNGLLVYYGGGVRPAFNLNLSSIIFTSDAAGIKSQGAAGTLSAPGNHTTAEWKLTVKDDNLSASISGNVTRLGSTITVPYTVSGTDRVSVFISDKAWDASGAALKYYGALDTSSGDGKGSFTLPDDYDSSWKVYILAENINDNTKTDYASTPVEISLDTPVTTYAVTVNNGTGNGDYAEGASVTISANEPESGKQFKEWTASGITLTDAQKSSKNLTFTMPANAVTLTATYEDIPTTTYAVTVNNGTGSGNYAAGASVTIIADAPENGKVFDKWTTSDGVTFANASSTTTSFTMPAKPVTVTATYRDMETVATPTFSPEGDTYTSVQNVTISCATDGATIYYTTDGSTPTTSSSTFTGVISVSTTTTIKAIAVKSGMTDSTVASATYTIKTAPVITKAPQAKANLVYNSQPQELVTAGEVTGGTFYYAIGTATEATEPYTTSIPSKTEAGIYYVWYKVVGDGNHRDTEEKCVEVTIAEDKK